MKWRRTRALLERELGTAILAAAILGTIAARPFRRLARARRKPQNRSAVSKSEKPSSAAEKESEGSRSADGVVPR